MRVRMTLAFGLPWQGTWAARPNQVRALKYLLWLMLILVPAGAQEPLALTLEDAARLAVAQNPSLRAALARLEQSREQVEIVASPARPQLTFSGSLAQVRQAAGPPVVASFPGLPVTEFQPEAVDYTTGQLDLLFRQLLFDSGRIRAQIDQARASSDVSAQTLVANSNQIALNARLAYLDALEARARENVQVEAVELAQAQLAAAEARFSAGSAPRADTVYARVPVSRAVLERTRGRLSVGNTQAALNRLMGLPQGTPLVLQEPETPGPVEGDFAASVARGRERRPEVVARRFELEAAQHGLRAALKDNAPAVYASADVNSVAYNEDAFLPVGSAGWRFALELRWPILEGNRKAHLVTQSEARVREAEALLADTQEAVELEVRQAYSGLETALEAYRSAQVQVDQAREAMEMAQGQYRAGVTPLLQVTEAQQTFLTARVDRLSAFYELLRSRARLQHARGDGLEAGDQGAGSHP